MSSLLRRSSAIGLTVLLISGPVNPIVASALSSTTHQAASQAVTSSVSELGAASAGFALTVSPTRLSIGQQDLGKSQQIRVANSGDTAIAVSVQKRNFTTAGDGTAVYQDDAPYSAAAWVRLDPMSFEIPPQTSQIVTAMVDVPAEPEPGDHQLALIFLVPAADSAANVKVNRGIGIPVFVTVAGEINDSVALNGLDAPWFAISGPVAVTAHLQNTGTVHRDFRAASPLLLDVAGTPSPFPDFTVPRDVVRDVTTTWDPPLLCICHPEIRVVNADGGIETASAQVIVFPLKLVGIVVGTLLFLALAFWLSRRWYRASVNRAVVASNRPARTGDA